MNNEKESFLKRKNVIISFKRYGIDAMGSMALGLFASLLICLLYTSDAADDLIRCRSRWSPYH